MTTKDAGTAIPLILLCFLLAGTFVTASTAASAAFLAQRDLAGICDGAAVAAAARGIDRGALGGDGEGLPLDPAAVAGTVDRYRGQAGRDGLTVTATTDGRTVTVICTRTVRIPFGAVLGHPGGLARTATARARSPLLPARSPRGYATVHSGQTQWTVPRGCWRRLEDRGTVTAWPRLSTPPLPRCSACCTRVR